MACDLKDTLRKEYLVIFVIKDPTYHIVPSNLWIAAEWRNR